MRDGSKLLMSCALLGVLAAPGARAQEAIVSPLEDYFRLTAGLLSASSETEMRLDADDGTPGTVVSGEDDLGLRDQSEMGDVELEFRIRKRHRLRVNYFRSDRSASQVIDREIQFGDDTFDAGDRVESRLDWREFSITYGYTFLRRARYDVYGSFGLHLAEVRAAGEVDADDIREEENQTFPIPAVGLGGLVRITDHFHFEGRVDYLTVSYEDVDGTLLDARGSVVYRFNRNLALGAAYVFTQREASSEEEGDSGLFDLRHSGPELFLRVTF
jgi:hypothetical protein